MSTNSTEDEFHRVDGVLFDRNAINHTIDKAKALDVPLVQTPGMDNSYFNALKAEEDYRNRT